MKMPSVMKGGHAFSTVPKAQIERSQFDRSHGHKTTFDEGYLVPVYVDEALPGDTFHLKMNGFCRLATPLKPLMDNLYLDTFFFAVPYRLVWANWQKFNGEQTNPGDSTSFTVPLISGFIGGAIGSIFDYMGLPLATDLVTPIDVNSLHLRAYNLIYNQWFRDENLINSITVRTADTGDVVADFGLQKRGKRHDYFTSCLPWPQKGTAVSIPLGTTAPVVATTAHAQPIFWGSLGGASRGSLTTPNLGTDDVFTTSVGTQNDVLGWDDPKLMADLASITGPTINSLRQAFQIQKMLERDARGGTRYTEIVKSHFGVTSPDARLQRPEYLGGGSAAIMVSPIAQNSAANAQPTPQGNLAGIGTVSFMGHGFVKSFTEHCLLLGLASVRADLTYQRGVHRMWTRHTRYDFFWPALAHIGEQVVLNQEIYATGAAADYLAFGYQERYAEYRYKPSLITGKFRSSYATPLDIWHLSQKFTGLPALNQAFIEEPSGATGPLYRTLAVPTEPHFLGDFWFDLKCARPMPVYGVPGMIDHF